MKRTVFPLSLLMLAGCRASTPTAAPAPATPSPTADSSPATVPARTSSTPGSVPITMVRQRALTTTPAGFDPTGQLVLDEDCLTWSADGTFRGTAPEAECQRWLEPGVRFTQDGQRRARRDGETVVLNGDGVAGTLTCKDCKEVLGVAWSPQGDQIALVRADGAAVEIWSATEHHKQATLDLDWSGDLSRVELGWSDGLHLLMATEDDRPLCDELEDYDEEVDCIDFYDVPEGGAMEYSLVSYAGLEATPVRQDISAGTAMYDVITEATLDPGGHCLYWKEVDSEPRESIGSRLVTRSISGECGLDSVDYYDEWDWSLDSVEWTEAPVPQLVAVTTGEFMGPGDGGMDGNKYRIEFVELDETRRRLWTAEVDSLDIVHSEDEEVFTWIEMTERELLAARAHEQVDLWWNHCFARHEGDDENITARWCTQTNKLPRGCTFADLDPQGRFTLARCGSNEALTLLGKKRIRLGGSDTHWLWTHDGLVTMDNAAGVVLRPRQNPSQSLPVGPASAWVPTTLGTAQGTLVLHEEGLVRLLNSSDGSERLRVETNLSPVVAAALAPSGTRLAITDGAQIELVDLNTKQAMLRWEATGVAMLAWRQDEEVVFSGPDIKTPTAAWNARSGEARPEQLPELGDAVLDPSWRWAMSTPHRAVRMLDGLEIWFDDAGVMLDDGRFEGTPATLAGIAFRLGDDPLRSAMRTPEQLRPLLEIEGLADDFFSGRTIKAAPTSVTVKQRDALLGS